MPPTEWKFGDMMRYPLEQDPADPPEWVFMFLFEHRLVETSYNHILIIRVPPDDDQWEPGQLLAAGIDEMVPLV